MPTGAPSISPHYNFHPTHQGYDPKFAIQCSTMSACLLVAVEPPPRPPQLSGAAPPRLAPTHRPSPRRTRSRERERDAAFAPTGTPVVRVKDAPVRCILYARSHPIPESPGGGAPPALTPAQPPSIEVDTPSSSNASPDGRRVLGDYRAYLDVLRWTRRCVRRWGYGPPESGCDGS